jgi:peptidoglycan hydrolase-like protein with peptidoglycan-binding domain
MTLGDGHDLKSDRFSLLLDLEADFDNEAMSKAGSKGRSVQAIQQALYDAGHSLPAFGADGGYGTETTAAVKDYQGKHPPLTADGKVGFGTMGALDAQFPNPALPGAADMGAAWTIPVVRSIVRPWSPHTIDVLATRITLKSFDSIGWVDERWDGAAWVSAPFPGGGYNTGTEIGVLNDTNVHMAETLYHEVLHAEQPSSQTTTLAKESYAYRIGEEFSIALGLTGRPSLRSTDAQGREFADRTKVDAFVSARYPSVVAGTGDEIIGKGAGAGTVRVQKPDGTIFTRAAVVGEKVPGPMFTTNEVTHAAADWTAP